MHEYLHLFSMKYSQQSHHKTQVVSLYYSFSSSSSSPFMLEFILNFPLFFRAIADPFLIRHLYPTHF